MTTPPWSINVNTSTNRQNEPASRDGPYVGIAIGCTIVVIMMIILIYGLMKKRHSSSKNQSTSLAQPRPHPQLNPHPHAQPHLHPPPPATPISLGDQECFQNFCLRFFQSLNLSEEYFEHRYDRCYCSKHYPDTKPKTHHIAGHVYTMPCGWIRISLESARPEFQNKNIFHTWTTSYYGTSVDQLENILRNKFPYSGDRLLNGQIFAPKFSQPKCCYTSPSIFYTSRLNVCAKYPFENHQFQVVLQCKQEPGTFKILPGQSGLCQLIPSNQIKWKTSLRATIAPIGLMIRLVQ